MSPAGKARMRISTPGTRSSPGFTLIELSIVLFVLGLLLWLVVPPISSAGGPSRDTVSRELAAGSEAAFDTALFEKREVRLVIDPSAGTYRFRILEGQKAPPAPPGRSGGPTI